MKKTILVALAVVAAAFGMARPSSAAVTASLAIVGPNALSTKCPVTASFTGSIGAPSGTVLTYSFNRFVNGAQQVVTGATVTMPGSGSIAVADSMSISASASGNTFDQIWVHNISGGQPDSYSNKASFSVACQTGSNSSSMQMALPPAGGWPPSPTGLTNTTDVDACAAHVNKLFCQAALGAGQMALIWNWSGNATYPSLDGYRVYRWDPGHPPALVVTTSAGDGPKGTFLNPPSDGGFNGKCYIVTGYVGSTESLRSNEFCVAGAGTPKTATLNVELARGWRIVWAGRTGVFGETHEKDFPCENLCIGYSHWTEIHDTGDLWGTAVDRSGVRFDVAALSPSSIVKAVLHLHRASGRLAPNDAANCVTQVAEGINQWWSSTGQIAGAFATYAIVVGGPGPDVDVDVTPLAKHWVSGPNNGLVLRGADEASKAFDNNHCNNFFDSGNATLELTYS